MTFYGARIKKLVLILGVGAITVSIFFFTIIKLNEGLASKSAVINSAKRVAAEAGVLLSNYVKVKERVMLNFGFNEYADKNIEKIDKFLAYLSATTPNGKKINIVRIDNPDICLAAFGFQYEDFYNHDVRALRDKYSLDRLVVNTKTDLEKFIILREWVRERISEGKPKNVDYNFNALNILERAERGERFFCSETATVFVQCVISLGYTGRYLGLFKGHILAEVWSNDFNKWVIMDVGDNLHYEKHGVPLSALELHVALESGDFSDIDVLYGIDKKHLSAGEKGFYISYYRDFFVRMRNDWFSNKYPHWHPKGNSIMNGLEWQGQSNSDNILVARRTSSSEELNFCLNMVSIMCDRSNSSEEEIQLIFNTFTPGFSNFLFSVDDGARVRGDNQRLTWKLHKGKNKIEVMAINVLGVSGSPSKVELIVE